MPRDIPVGNGHMLVTFDHHYQIRDLYFPHVGQENHAGGGPCRFGVWGTLAKTGKSNERRKARVYWSDDQWQIERGYQDDTLATHVVMRHDDLGLELRCADVVDFHRPVLVRRIEIVNLTDTDREVRLFHQQDFQMYGTKVGDTAYFDPQLRSIIHYRASRYIMAGWYLEGDQQLNEYATGTAGFGGAEGTWRDAEDGCLGNNPIAQGAVDSTIALHVQLPAHESRIAYLVIGCGKNHKDLEMVHKFLHRESPQGVIDRTNAYWKLWLAATKVEFPESQVSGLSPKIEALYKRSLLVLRTQIDNNGAIIAANDSDIMQFSRDTYSYLWPRDGAFVADAIDAAGFPDVARSFFAFCVNLLTDYGCFLHKYNPDGTPASSWHPWVANGRPQFPIQEDETALVVWALWRHYVRYRDIEFVRPLWVDIVQKAADFMVRYRDPATHLPLPSYDLWEERWGVHAFTVASVYAGLKSAWQFAVCFGDTKRAQRYATAAEQTRTAFCKHFWSQKHGRFLRRITPTDHQRTSELMADVVEGRAPEAVMAQLDRIFGCAGVSHAGNQCGLPPVVKFEHDTVLDASMFAIFALGLLPVHDERVVKTMNAIEDELWIKTGVGGVARYADDYYHQVSRDTARIPGNPWFICTLWLADYYIARAQTVDELKQAVRIFDWVEAHALPSHVLAEQVHPETNAPLSVSPLTWSHATVVASLVSYLDKLEALQKNGGASNGQRIPGVERVRRKPIPEPSPIRD